LNGTSFHKSENDDVEQMSSKKAMRLVEFVNNIFGRGIGGGGFIIIFFSSFIYFPGPQGREGEEGGGRGKETQLRGQEFFFLSFHVCFFSLNFF